MLRESHEAVSVLIGLLAIGLAAAVCLNNASPTAVPGNPTSVEQIDSEANYSAREFIASEGTPVDERIRQLSGFLTNPRLANDTRRLSAMALARMPDASSSHAVPILLRQLRQHDPKTVTWTAKTLGTFGTHAASAAPALISLLDHPTAMPRNAAIEALANIGVSHPAVVPALGERAIAWRSTESPELLESLEFVLDGIGQIGSDAAPCIPSILRTVDSRHTRIRMAAVTALGEMGPRADVAATTLVERLMWDDAAEVRAQAITAVAKIGTAAIPPLSKALTIDEQPGRIGAIQALGMLGNAARTQLPALISLTESPAAPVALAAAKAVHHVSNGGIDVSPILLRSLAHKQREVRMEAARQFSQIGEHGRTEAVHKALNKLAISPNSGEKQAALKVLRDLFEH